MKLYHATDEKDVSLLSNLSFDGKRALFLFKNSTSATEWARKKNKVVLVYEVNEETYNSIEFPDKQEKEYTPEHGGVQGGIKVRIRPRAYNLLIQNGKISCLGILKEEYRNR